MKRVLELLGEIRAKDPNDSKERRLADIFVQIASLEIGKFELRSKNNKQFAKGCYLAEFNSPGLFLAASLDRNYFRYVPWPSQTSLPH